MIISFSRRTVLYVQSVSYLVSLFVSYSVSWSVIQLFNLLVSYLVS